MGPRTSGDVPTLLAGDVHVWSLDLAGTCPPEAVEHLSDDDWHRAGRFAFDRDRGRFLRARYALRQLLGSYLGMLPRELPLTLNRHGKPQLDPALAFGFNLSHSGDHGLLAVGRVAQIGVDIEAFARRTGLRELAASVFTAEELLALEGVAETGYERAFLTGWTRKEAMLKALGVGLALEPTTVHAGTAEGRTRMASPGGAAGEFIEVATLPVDERFVAALAVAGGFSEMHVFTADRETSQLLESRLLRAEPGPTPKLRQGKHNFKGIGP